MTTVSELIEYMQKLPPDTEVEVIEGYDCGYATCTRIVNLDLDELSGNVEFTDFRDNPFVSESDPYYKKTYLLLGTA